jgi:DNA primase large subunit
MNAHRLLTERHKTIVQTPAHVYARSVVASLRDEIVRLRAALVASDATIERLLLIMHEQRDLLRAAEPCPSCVARAAERP